MYDASIDPGERNPIYPNALRLCDIQNGVPCRIINVRSGTIRTGIISGKPFFPKKHSEDCVQQDMKVCIETAGQRSKFEIYLGDAGIVKYNHGTKPWNHFNLTIRDTPDDIKLYQDWLKKNDKKTMAVAGLLSYINDTADRIESEDEDEYPRNGEQ